MFWAMMYMLFFSSSLAPELLLPDEIKFQNTIADEQRLETVLAIHREVKTSEQALSETVKNLYDDLAQLSPQYDADINRFRDVFNKLDLKRANAQVEWLDKRFQMKGQMTRKEWKKVFGKKSVFSK